ncbi:MAG TPA: hypothetical protein VGN23_15905 [Verrucomicrobiae bacterium]|jgi:hypothetical protein
MGTDHSRPGTGLEPFETVLTQRNGQGQPFVIVGGQAANIWAAYYLPHEPRLEMHFPFTSKDLDLIGTGAEAAQVAEAIGWYLSAPAFGGGPVEAVLSSQPQGAGLKVEFLREIKGVPHETVMAYARENVVRVAGGNTPQRVRVLDPVLLMAGKIRNAVDIEQNQPEKPRQDVKHVAMLALCVSHFLGDMQAQAVGSKQQREICGHYVTMLASLKNTFSARQFEARHPGIILWPELIPQTVRPMAFDPQIQSSLQQLCG